jgi:hypothetical protein
MLPSSLPRSISLTTLKKISMDAAIKSAKKHLTDYIDFMKKQVLRYDACL